MYTGWAQCPAVLRMKKMRYNKWHVIMPWLLLNLSVIPHDVLGGDSSPVPSSPAPPMQFSASAKNIASALFTTRADPHKKDHATEMPPGVTDELLKKAWEGQTVGCFQLGLAWHNQNPLEAAKWYRLAATQGYALAQANLGVLYEKYLVAPNAHTLVGEGNLTLADGRRIARGEATFFELHDQLQTRLRSARLTGQFALADFTQRSINRLLADSAESIYWYQRAAEQGHAAAQYNLGRIYGKLAKIESKSPVTVPPPALYAEGEPTALFKTTTTAAKKGDSNAQYNLGLIYFYGQGTAKNPAEAAKWWREATTNYHPAAEHGLAYLQAKGIGIQRNIDDSGRKYRKLAYFYLKKAADQQVRNAWLDLGHLYLELATDPERQRIFAQQSQQANNGQGAPLLPEKNLDYRFARLWLTQSAQQFSHRITAKGEDHTSTGIAAQYGLPSVWIEKVNPSVDFGKLVPGQMVQIPGSPDAMLTLGRMELEGAGAPANPQLSARWFRQAAQMDLPGAHFHLAYMFQIGVGVPQNLFLAHRHYQSAARLNHARAQYNLGLLYYQGKSVGQRQLFRYKNQIDLSEMRGVLEQRHPRLAAAQSRYVEWEGRPYLEVIAPAGYRNALKQDLTRFFPFAKVTPAATPIERVHMSFDQAHKLEDWEIPTVLQHLDGQLQRDAIVRYLTKNGHELLAITTPAGLGEKSAAVLQHAFPKAKFKIEGPIEMLGDPLWDTYANVKIQRGEGNRLAYQWWKVAEMNGLPDAQDRREFLTRFLPVNTRNSADNAAANARREFLKAGVEPASTRLSRVTPASESKVWAAGFVVSADGYIVTSSDLFLKNPKQIRIKTESGAVFKARVADSNSTMNGFALLKVDGYRFRPLPLNGTGDSHVNEKSFVLGFKVLNKSKSGPDACSILTHIASTQGNQADPRYVTLSDAILGDRLFLQFNKFLNSAGTANDDSNVFNPKNVFHAKHPVIVKSIKEVRTQLIAQNENLAHAPQFGYLLNREQWYEPGSGEWSFTKPQGKAIHHGKGEFVYLDGSQVRTAPLADGVVGRRQILRILAPTGLAETAGEALREAFWQAGFERQSMQAGLRGAALLNHHGQAIALHFPPLSEEPTHDYPNFNTYDRHLLKIEALLNYLRAQPKVQLDVRRPHNLTYAKQFTLSKAHNTQLGLQGFRAYRPDGWIPPSAHYGHSTHHTTDEMQNNLAGCNLTLECINSPMISRARASMVLVQIED